MNFPRTAHQFPRAVPHELPELLGSPGLLHSAKNSFLLCSTAVLQELPGISSVCCAPLGACGRVDSTVYKA